MKTLNSIFINSLSKFLQAVILFILQIGLSMLRYFDLVSPKSMNSYLDCIDEYYKHKHKKHATLKNSLIYFINNQFSFPAFIFIFILIISKGRMIFRGNKKGMYFDFKTTKMHLNLKSMN